VRARWEDPSGKVTISVLTRRAQNIKRTITQVRVGGARRRAEDLSCTGAAGF